MSELQRHQDSGNKCPMSSTDGSRAVTALGERTTAAFRAACSRSCGRADARNAVRSQRPVARMDGTGVFGSLAVRRESLWIGGDIRRLGLRFCLPLSIW